MTNTKLNGNIRDIIKESLSAITWMERRLPKAYLDDQGNVDLYSIRKLKQNLRELVEETGVEVENEDTSLYHSDGSLPLNLESELVQRRIREQLAEFKKRSENRQEIVDKLKARGPLIDDGDALKLVVALSMRIYVYDCDGYVVVAGGADGRYPHVSVKEEFNGDKFAATRLAIYRAAEELTRPV